MELSVPWLEAILKRHENEKRIERVIEAKKESVVAKGDNYCSELSRLNMKVILGSGKIVNKSVVMKDLPASELSAKNFKEWGVFRNEITIYQDVLPLMEELLEELETKEEPLWGQCIFSRPYDLIILEDLKELGYKMADRQKGLDLKHTQAVIMSLGKYHAMSIILRDRGLIQPTQFTESFFIIKDPQMAKIIQGFHDQSLESLATAIETFWEPEWLRFKEKVLAFKSKSLSVIDKIIKESDPKLCVLNHGDCWTNNMLFKYDSQGGEVVGHKFVDFQVPFYTSMGYDLSYFFTTSSTRDIFKSHMDQVLTTYVKAYEKTFEKLKHEGPIPTLDEVKGELVRFCLHSLIICGMLLPTMMGTSEDAPDVEEMFKNMEKENKVNVKMRSYGSKVYMAKAQYILEWCEKNQLFKL